MPSQNAPAEFDITGMVVRARPEKVARLTERLRALRGVEVHAASEQGNLVVTVEEIGGEQLVMTTIEAINNMPGVVSTSLVYHHREEQAL
ncbi:chaperone NapD [Motiliproteus sp. SC1-56]|uniref:chaperone NapD n=1 Tax=Motiliproteus sp. SC1-56 TaxID=2799565 RepID=UPI001A8BF4A5|nr:chaperone NapD [Motiliproteus sp. SC1-56]